jgi:Putative addiction module component.
LRIFFNRDCVLDADDGFSGKTEKCIPAKSILTLYLIRRFSITISLPLDRMTTVEKLQTMEALWEDLSKKSDEFISPSWHGEILSKRDKNLSEGKDLIQDWDEAKERIRRSIE